MCAITYGLFQYSRAITARSAKTEARQSCETEMLETALEANKRAVGHITGRPRAGCRRW